MARNPPACPADKRSLCENLVNDRRIPCSAQVRLRTEAGMGLNFIVLKFRLGSASEPNVCSATSRQAARSANTCETGLLQSIRTFHYDLSLLNISAEFGQNFCFLFLAYISIFPFHLVPRFYRCVCCEDLHRQPLWRLDRRQSLTTLGPVHLGSLGDAALMYNEENTNYKLITSK